LFDIDVDGDLDLLISSGDFVAHVFEDGAFGNALILEPNTNFRRFTAGRMLSETSTDIIVVVVNGFRLSMELRSIEFGPYAKDCNSDSIPDECGDDCNGNRISDSCDLENETSLDCNLDGIPDECQVDCNGNGVVDECDVTSGTSEDCDGDLIPDECNEDCNDSGLPDACDVTNGTSEDCDQNMVPDECQLDCNSTGQPDPCDIAGGTSEDQNRNGVPDECETVAAFRYELVPSSKAPTGGKVTEFQSGVSPLGIDFWLHTIGLQSGVDGAQGLLSFVVSRGCDATSVTLQGTAAADVNDDPPGLRCGGFEHVRIGDPDFLVSQNAANPEADGAIEIAIVWSFTKAVTLEPGDSPHLIARMEFSSIDGDEDCSECEIAFGDHFYVAGTDSDHVLTWRGRSVTASRDDIQVTFCPQSYRRGDANSDGRVDISDATTIFSTLFLTGAPISCRRAADVNSSDRLDITDGVYLLNFLFRGGPPPAPPRDCDESSETESSLPCESYDACT
ncbi:MAG: hypothetical protein AAF517_27280, partial [Planctomycetota bacterium]